MEGKLRCDWSVRRIREKHICSRISSVAPIRENGNRENNKRLGGGGNILAGRSRDRPPTDKVSNYDPPFREERDSSLRQDTVAFFIATLTPAILRHRVVIHYGWQKTWRDVKKAQVRGN